MRPRTEAAVALAVIDMVLVLYFATHGYGPDLIEGPGGAIIEGPRFNVVDIAGFTLIGAAHVAVLVAFMRHRRRAR